MSADRLQFKGTASAGDCGEMGGDVTGPDAEDPQEGAECKKGWAGVHGERGPALQCRRAEAAGQQRRPTAGQTELNCNDG